MPDFLFLLESRLNPEQLKVVEQVQSSAWEAGLHLYLVGGALRDLIYGYPIRDLDFAVEGQALKVARSVAKRAAGCELLETDEDLRSAHLVFPGGLTAEISACRWEERDKRGRLEVEFGDIYRDLRRRDFSMNAIGLSLNPNSRGLLLDPNNGVADIERHEIRVLQSSAFSDDPVRLIRAVRFRTRLRFTMEPKTESLFRAGLERGMENASPDGLRKEFKEMGREENPLEILKALEKEGLTTAFHPRLTGSRLNVPVLTQMLKTARTIAEAAAPVDNYAPFLYFLLEKLPARDRSALIHRLGMKRADTEPLTRLENDSKQLVKALAGKQGGTPSKAFQLLAQQPGEVLLFVLMEFPQKKIQDKIKNYIHRHRKALANLPKAELIGLGVMPDSPRYQKILDAYFFGMLDGKVKTSKDPLKPLRKVMAEVK